MVSDTGTNSVFVKFQNVCRCLGIHHAVFLSYNCQSNGQAEACIKFFTNTVIKWCETIVDTYMALLHITSTPASLWLPRPAELLFDRPARGILPKFSRLYILCDNDENNYTNLVNRPLHAYVDVYTHKTTPVCPQGKLKQCNTKMQDPGCIDTNGAWFWWPQSQKLQNRGDQDETHNHKNPKMHNDDSNHGRGLPKKWHVKDQLTTYSRQT